jgi:hypothetical protein
MSLITDASILSPEKVLCIALLAAPGRVASAEWLSDTLSWGAQRVESALAKLQASGRLNYDGVNVSFVERAAAPVFREPVVASERVASGEASVVAKSRERAAVAKAKREANRVVREATLLGKEERDMASVTAPEAKKVSRVEKSREAAMRGKRGGAYLVEEWFRTWIRENGSPDVQPFNLAFDGKSLKLASMMIEMYGMENLERLVRYFFEHYQEYSGRDGKLTGMPDIGMLYGYRTRIASDMVGFKGKNKVKQGDYDPEKAAKCPDVGW